MCLWYPCPGWGCNWLLNPKLAPRASTRRPGCWTALGLSALSGHGHGSRAVPGAQFGYGSLGCTFLVSQVWQKLVLIRGDDGMIDRTLLAPTP